MFEHVERPARGDSGFQSQVRTEPPQSEAPRPVDSKQRVVTVAPGLITPNSWLREVAGSVTRWQNDMPMMLSPEAGWHNNGTRQQPWSHPRKLETFSLDYVLRIFPADKPWLFARHNRHYIDVIIAARLTGEGKEVTETGLDFRFRRADGSAILFTNGSSGRYVSFSPFLPTLESGHSQYWIGERDTSRDKDQRNRLILEATPKLYLEGFARGYQIGSAARPQQQLVSNDRPIKTGEHLPTNQELAKPAILADMLELGLRPSELFHRADQAQRASQNPNYCHDWTLLKPGPGQMWYRAVLNLHAELVAGGYPFKLQVNSGKDEPVFLRHFNHPYLLATFVRGLAHGTSIGDALRRPIGHKLGET